MDVLGDEPDLVDLLVYRCSRPDSTCLSAHHHQLIANYDLGRDFLTSANVKRISGDDDAIWSRIVSTAVSLAPVIKGAYDFLRYVVDCLALPANAKTPQETFLALAEQGLAVEDDDGIVTSVKVNRPVLYLTLSSLSLSPSLSLSLSSHPHSQDICWTMLVFLTRKLEGPLLRRAISPPVIAFWVRIL
jgi:hypothetical protein